MGTAQLSLGEWQQDTIIQSSNTISENPKNEDYYNNDSETNSRLLVREVFEYHDDLFRFDGNIYNLMVGTSDKQSAARFQALSGEAKNRSVNFERHWHNSHAVDGFLVMDRLYVSGEVAEIQYAIGRFPINLATTAVFAPLDLFAPFRPHNFYRQFKPGVDAIKLSRGLSESSSITLYGVRGYESDVLIALDGLKRDQEFSYEESSVLAQGNMLLFDTALGFVLGRYGKFDLGGLSAQGEWQGMGIRASAHQKKHRSESFAATEAALAIEARTSEKLFLTFEQYLHGQGYSQRSDYKTLGDDPFAPTYFIGRNYSAFVMLYQWTPLNQIKSLTMINLLDASWLTALNLNHSVSENAELTSTVLVPHGRIPKDNNIESEFGTYPKVLSVSFSLTL
jgi:hypothetical protein